MKLTSESPEQLKIADQKGRITLGSRYAGKHFVIREEPDGTAILTPVLVLPEKERPLTSRQLAESFFMLETLEDNWDGHGSPRPAPRVVDHARDVLALFHAGLLARGRSWEEPHIGANERGQVTLEWWRDQRNLTVFVRSEDLVEYLKSWGSDIVSEMEDGEISRLSDFLALAHWLYQGDNRPQ